VSADWIVPDWPAPSTVRALVTTRHGGVSEGPWASMNLGTHVGDAADAVRRNRAMLRARLPNEPCWLEQVHGTAVIDATQDQGAVAQADASVARRPGAVCVVLTADCLPVLFCDRAGSVVAAAHAGWRGLAAGVLEATVSRMQVPPATVMAWLGPAIGPNAFEVGDDVRQSFMSIDLQATSAFVPGAAPGKWMADLYRLARMRLSAIGVEAIHGGGLCTLSNARFYSYRRDGITGRFASLAWRAA
jgi:hypothetical protein